MTLKPSEVLQAIVDMSDEDRTVLFNCLDFGMHDEWDCNIMQGIELFGGGAEMGIAAKSAVLVAKRYEEGEVNNDNG